MRVAMFSPMPPARSGIADYSAALAASLERLVTLEVFDSAAARFDPARFDIALYQVGNNPWHEFVYEQALAHPGVVVLHEANLHYLIADLTIRRGDWDAYLREIEYNSPAALPRALRARSLEVGPDYEGVALTRRILECVRGVITHSVAVTDHVAEAGYRGPVAQIPHGAWIGDADGRAYRERLGVEDGAPLIGVFGFLKPYKRIPESLRALRRLVRLEPRAKMILVGEPHPDLPLNSLVATLGLSGNVRTLGFVPVADFSGYMAACDIVLNLRYPTVGESSGSLVRALGLGKPVLVSDVGAFRDLPEDVCLKVPVGAGEEDCIFEFLSLLVSRPDLAHALGARARSWAAETCSWDAVARRYAAFLREVVEGTAAVAAVAAAAPANAPEPVNPGAVLRWVPPDPVFREYVDLHLTRLTKTLEITPPGGPGDAVLEMGAYLQITPALRSKLGHGEVRGCYYGPAGQTERRSVVSADGETFECELDLFDAEKDPFPYRDGHFATVLCCELVEHLTEDPMHLMVEVNRVLREGGHLVLTTPNIAALRSVAAVLEGYHPGLFPQYIKPAQGGEVDPRHNREYTPNEIRRLLEDAGFEVVRLETGPFREQPRPELAWVRRLLERNGFDTGLRGDGIYAVGRKTGPVRTRYPEWLYA